MTLEMSAVRLDLPATFAFLHVLGTRIESLLAQVEGLEDSRACSYQIQLAVHEVAVNIVNHAYAGRQDGRIQVTLQLADLPRRLLIELHDTGVAFNPDAVPQPDLDEPQEHGYGLFLVRCLMDNVAYQSGPEGNSWRLVKLLDPL